MFLQRVSDSSYQHRLFNCERGDRRITPLQRNCRQEEFLAWNPLWSCGLCKADRNKTWPPEFSFGAPGMVLPEQGEAENHPGSSCLPHCKGSSPTFRRGSGREGGMAGPKNRVWGQPLEVSWKVFRMRSEQTIFQISPLFTTLIFVFKNRVPT